MTAGAVRAHRRIRVGTLNAHDNRAAFLAALDGLDLLLGQEVPHGTVDHLPAGWFGLESGHGADLTIAARREVFRRVQRPLEGYHQAHEGRRRVTPNRGTLLAPLVVVDTGEDLSVMCGHRINRTSRRWFAVPGVKARWRRRRLAEHKQLDRDLCHKLTVLGRTWILGGGDYNERVTVLPALWGRWLVNGRSIDKLWNAGRRVSLVDTRSERVPGTDHQLRVAVVQLPYVNSDLVAGLADYVTGRS